MFQFSAVHHVLRVGRRQRKHAAMILVGIVRLEFLPLKPHPFRGRVCVPPLNIMKHVRRKTEHSRQTGSTMVIGFQRHTVAKNGVLDEKGSLIGKADVATSIGSSTYVGTTTITEVLRFLPIKQIDIVVTVVSMVLKIACLVVSDEGVMIVQVVDNRCRQASLVSLVGESLT